MQRTQIYFPEQLHEDLRIGAKMMGVSFSEYIRRILEENLYLLPGKSLKPRTKKADLSIIAKNAVSFGIKDLARNFDKYFEESLKWQSL